MENADILPEGTGNAAIEKIIREEELQNPKITISAGSVKGDNYVGIIQKVEVTSDSKTINLIFKSSSKNEHMRHVFPMIKLFEREVMMYDEYLPTLANLEKELNVKDSFMSYVKMHDYSLKEMDEYLILSDKKSEGFIMVDRKHPVDLPQCEIVLKELGKFHAASFALKHYHPETFQIFAQRADDVLMNAVHNLEMIKRHYETVGEKAFKSLDPEKDIIEIEKFSKFKEHIFDIAFMFSKNESFDEYCVIVHGDCWSNNILYKYDNSQNSENPGEVCFLDWQLSRYGSPIIDLAYFIYNCSSTEVKNSHFDHMLNTYYSSLANSLKQMNCDPEVMYPRKVFDDHIQKYFKFGVAVACSLLNLFTSDSDEIPDLQSIKDFGEEELEKWNFISKNIDLYNERMSGVIRHAVKKGFI